METKTILLTAIFGMVVALSGCISFGSQISVDQEEPAVEMLDYPTSVRPGQVFAVKWRVNLEGTVPHTSVHWDNVSHAGEFGTNVTPADSGYTDLVTEFASGNFTVPAEFEGNATAPSKAGTMYLRGHAIHNGQQYWTDEFTISVTGAAVEVNVSANASGSAGLYGY